MSAADRPDRTPRPAPATGVRAAQSEAAVVERQQAIRALLARPLLGQREVPETFAAIVRHRRELVDWFAEHVGWQLVVDVSGGVARLHKTDDRDDDTRPAVAGRHARPFDRRRYTLLCLALAALDERGGQTSLKHVAEAVAAHSRTQEGVTPFDAARMGDRRALVDALKLLTGLGVIALRDGDSDRYAASGSGDALYDIDDRRIAQLVAAPSSPSLVDAPEDLPVEVYPDSEEGERLRARHRVMRRLLDEPVVYYDELNERERDWLTHSLGHVHTTLAGLGFEVERRAEGLLAVDPDREVTDETFPDGSSTVKHAALLLAEQLCERVRAARGGERPAAGAGARGGPRGEQEDGAGARGAPHPGRADDAAGARGAPQGEQPEAGQAPVVSDGEVEALAGRLLDVYGAGWSAAYRQRDDGAALLAADALALLRRFGLVARVEAAAGAGPPTRPTADPPSAGGWRPRPAIARYAPAPPRPGRGSQPSLAFEPRGAR